MRSRGWRILGLCFGVHRALTVMYFGGVVVAGVLPPAFTIATGALVSAVAAGGDGVWGALAIAGALYLAQHLLAPLQGHIGSALVQRVDEDQAEQLMIALGEPPGLAHVEDPATLDAIAKAQGTLVGATPGGAAGRLGAVWNLRLQGAISLVIVGSWRWWVPLALLPVYVLAFRVSGWHWRQVTEVMYGRTEAMRRSYYIRKLALSPAIAKETRVFGLATWLVDRYRGGSLAVMREVWRRRSEGWLAAVGLYGLIAAAEAAVMIAVAGEAVAGELALGQAVVIAGAIAAAGGLAAYHDGHWYVDAAMDALDRLEALRQRAGELGGVVGGTAAADELPRRTIRFEGVRFAYPGRGAPVFAELDLEIEAGRSLAIVGENGAGKTTLVKLLARLYDPDAGRITVDGVDLRTLEPRSWHRRVAAIFQDFTQFELSAE
ncbi:MAG TPA: ABC transporter ATP-binding protein/permease, partial [Kofleriaceae bacterium]